MTITIISHYSTIGNVIDIFMSTIVTLTVFNNAVIAIIASTVTIISC